MMLQDLKPDIGRLPPDEALALVVKHMNSRFIPKPNSRSGKKAASVKAAAVKKTTQKFDAVIAGMSEAERRALLEKMMEEQT